MKRSMVLLMISGALLVSKVDARCLCVDGVMVDSDEDSGLTSTIDDVLDVNIAGTTEFSFSGTTFDAGDNNFLTSGNILVSLGYMSTSGWIGAGVVPSYPLDVRKGASDTYGFYLDGATNDLTATGTTAGIYSDLDVASGSGTHNGIKSEIDLTSSASIGCSVTGFRFDVGRTGTFSGTSFLGASSGMRGGVTNTFDYTYTGSGEREMGDFGSYAFVEENRDLVVTGGGLIDAGYYGMYGVSTMNSGHSITETSGTINVDNYGGFFRSKGLTHAGNGLTTGYGIWATSTGHDTNWAGYFVGDVRVTGQVYQQDILLLGDSATEVDARRTVKDINSVNITGSGTIGVVGDFSNATDLNYKIEITTGGETGTAVWRWSDDGGSTWDESNITIKINEEYYPLNHDITVWFVEGVGTDFNANDYITFTGVGTNNQKNTLLVDNTNNDVTLADTLVVASGSITDTGGAISFGDEDLSTTGDVNTATLTLWETPYGAKFDVPTNDYVRMQGVNSGEQTVFEITSQDQDGTDDVKLVVKGLSNAGTGNTEYLEIGYDATDGELRIKEVLEGPTPTARDVNIINTSGAQVLLDTSGIVHIPNAAFTVGVSDTTKGVITVSGDGTGSNDGGFLNLYCPADFDTIINLYGLHIFQDELRIGPLTNLDALKLDGSNFYVTGGNLGVTGDIAVSGIVDGVDVAAHAADTSDPHGANMSISTKLTTPEIENTGDITIDAINAAADSTIALINSDGTYNADLSIEGKLIHYGDSDTFISFGTDQINFKAGGVEYWRLVELASDDYATFNEGGLDVDYRFEGLNDINLLFLDAGNDRIGIGTATPTAGLQMGDDKLIAVDTNAGITASTTQTQGNGALTAQVNEISTVANDDDTITLPTAVTGVKIEIINNGLNTLRIFPASGDDLGLGVNTFEELEANESVGFVAYDTTNWAKESTTEIIHAEIHDEDNTDAFVINDAGRDFHSYHTNGLAAGDLADWTFDAGGAGTSFPITSIADGADSGVDIAVTTTGLHGLAVGDIISQTNLADANYVGIFEVKAFISTTIYEVAAVYTATDTGTVDQAATLEADAVAAGSYSFAYYISAKPVGNQETFDFQLYKEATAVIGSKIRRKFGAQNDFGSMSGGGIVDIANGEKISFALSNENSNANLTIRNLTIVLVRL